MISETVRYTNFVKWEESWTILSPIRSRIEIQNIHRGFKIIEQRQKVLFFEKLKYIGHLFYRILNLIIHVDILGETACYEKRSIDIWQMSKHYEISNKFHQQQM